MKWIAMMIFIVVILFTSGCAHATQIAVDFTWPALNTPQGSCVPTPGDSCRDLAKGLFYAQQQGTTDSVLVYTANGTGQMGKAMTIWFDRPDGYWNIWCWIFDASGNRSFCRSNVITRIIYTAPAAPTLR